MKQPRQPNDAPLTADGPSAYGFLSINTLIYSLWFHILNVNNFAGALNASARSNGVCIGPRGLKFSQLKITFSEWGCSSGGRAVRSQRTGQGFDSPHLHHFFMLVVRSQGRIEQHGLRFGRQGKGLPI